MAKLTLTSDEKRTLKILLNQKGPRQFNGLKKEFPKIKLSEIKSLVKKELVRVRKGYFGRPDRYEIRAAGKKVFAKTK